METEKIKENLCIYDSMNPDYIFDEDNKTPRNNCFCDNCFYGRDELALELLKMENEKMTQTNGNEVLESAKDSVMCGLKDVIEQITGENPDYNLDNIRDEINDNGLLYEIVDSSVPMYYHDIFACASVPDIYERESELGPAYDGSPTLNNIIVGLIYEYLMEYAWEILEEITNEILEDSE